MHKIGSVVLVNDRVIANHRGAFIRVGIDERHYERECLSIIRSLPGNGSALLSHGFMNGYNVLLKELTTIVPDPCVYVVVEEPLGIALNQPLYHGPYDTSAEADSVRASFVINRTRDAHFTVGTKRLSDEDNLRKAARLIAEEKRAAHERWKERKDRDWSFEDLLKEEDGNG